GTFENSADRLLSVSDVKNVDLDMWKFSQKLLKNVADIQDESSLTPPVQGLATNILVQLWDNVLFDVWSRKNRSVRQACLQMIVASNYVQTINDSTLMDNAFIDEFINKPVELDALPIAEKKKIKMLQRIARSAVVIPTGFTREKSSVPNSSNGALKKNYKYVKSIHEAQMAKIRCEAFESVVNELKNLGTEYEHDFEQAQELNDRNYDQTYDTAISNWRVANKIYIQEVVNDNRQNPGYDVEDYIPEDEIPEKTFNFDRPMSEAYAQTRLTPFAYNMTRDCGLEADSVEASISVIKKLCRKEKKKMGRVMAKKVAGAIINGVPIKRVSRNRHDYAISLTEVPVWDTNASTYVLKKQFFATIILDREGAFPTSTSADFDLDIAGSFQDSSPVIVSNDNNVLCIRLFDEDNFDNVTDEDRFQFSASLTLDNGTTLYLGREGVLSSGCTAGTAGMVNSNSSEELHYGIQNLGVADFRRVEQELCCYIPGEVSHIENVMAREYKERSTRSLSRYEESFQQLNEVEQETLSDTTSTSRDEMVSEINNIVTEDRSRNVGLNVNVNGDLGKAKYFTGVRTDFGFSASSSDSNRAAQTFAEDLTSRALERVVQFSSSQRSQIMTKEFEDSNRHGFDNRGGDAHVSGVYRWVDKVFKNRLVNYGKKLIYEFVVPEPSRWYKQAVLIEAEENNGLSQTATGSAGTAGALIEPIHPREYGILKAEDLNDENYGSLCSEYGVTDIPTYPNEEVSKSQSYSGPSSDRNGDSQVLPGFQIPDGYEVNRVRIHGHGNKKRGNSMLSLSFASANYQRTSGHGNFEISLSKNVASGIEGTTSFSYTSRRVRGWSATVTAYCTPTQNTIDTWKQEVYAAIINEYETQLKAYNDAATAALLEAQAAQTNAEDEAEQGRNPKFNDQIVHNELKRLCIEMMMRSFGIQQGKEFYKNDPACDIPYLPSDRDLGDYKLIVEFFEEAFDWELMAQQFYPYYWAARCQWKELFQSTDSLDQSFQSFLQSGMAKVAVPVREGHEAAVSYFTETGEIWTGTNLVVDTDDEIHLSLVNETYEVDGIVEKTWETIVPTSLTIIQKDSVGLDAYGLPCCDTDLLQGYTGEFELSQNKLQEQTQQ
ncbi:MAG: hypothetical protein AAF193_01000, partial [Bacteroidota bacterium]